MLPSSGAEKQYLEVPMIPHYLVKISALYIDFPAYFNERFPDFSPRSQHFMTFFYTQYYGPSLKAFDIDGKIALTR